MKKASVGFAVLIVGLVIVGFTMPAAASIVLTPQAGNSSATILHNGDAKFVDWNNFVGGALIVGKDVSDVDDDVFVLDVTYAKEDFTLPGTYGYGFRFGERIVNDSPVPWVDFHIDLEHLTGVFLNFTAPSGDEHPGFATFDFSNPSLPVLDLLSELGYPDPQGRVMNLSVDQKSIWMTFATPVKPGESFDIYLPIGYLGNEDGTFTLKEKGTTPEPVSAIVWSLLAGLGLTAAWRRRGKRT